MICIANFNDCCKCIFYTVLFLYIFTFYDVFHILLSCDSLGDPWNVYCIVLCCTLLYCIVLYRIVSYRVVSCRVLLYCIVLYCIVLYCIVLCCIVLYLLYCIILYSKFKHLHTRHKIRSNSCYFNKQPPSQYLSEK